jgi:hypothetical protein
MRIRLNFKTLTLLIVVLAALTIGQASAHWQIDLQSSHINTDVPDEKEFDSILTRDLVKYMSDVRKDQIAVRYELLRKEPTQSGVAYPKFYLWIKVIKSGELVEEGAVRVAAIEKKGFDVTDYLKKEDIRRSPTTVYKVFPRALCDKIFERAKD